MHLCPFEDGGEARLAPLTHTRAAFDLRVGARTLLEAQRAAFPEAEGLSLQTNPAVTDVARQEHPDAVATAPRPGGVLFVNARWRPAPGAALQFVRDGVGRAEARAFVQDGTVLALWNPTGGPTAPDADVPQEAVEGATIIDRLWHLVDETEARVAEDVVAMGGLGVRKGATVHDGALLLGAANIHLAPGAVVRPGAILDGESGPIRLEAGAVVEEHAIVRGPCWIGPGSTVKAAARVDGSAIGPRSKVAGEVHASTLIGMSNKAHDGYLGNSYIGRWCNLGAGTDTSNLRNDYGEVTMWDPEAGDFLPTGRQFLGLLMADHAKCAIGSRFNTGTVVGVASNLYGSGFPPRRVPSFSWGGDEGLTTYRLDKALQVAEAAMARRQTPLTAADRALLTRLFERTAPARAAVFG